MSYTTSLQVSHSIYVIGKIITTEHLDELEYSRLDKQHLVHLLANDGLVHKGVANQVRAVLDPNNPTMDGSPRRVLDLGW